MKDHQEGLEAGVKRGKGEGNELLHTQKEKANGRSYHYLLLFCIRV